MFQAYDDRNRQNIKQTKVYFCVFSYQHVLALLTEVFEPLSPTEDWKKVTIKEMLRRVEEVWQKNRQNQQKWGLLVWEVVWLSFSSSWLCSKSMLANGNRLAGTNKNWTISREILTPNLWTNITKIHRFRRRWIRRWRRQKRAEVAGKDIPMKLNMISVRQWFSTFFWLYGTLTDPKCFAAP